MFSIFFKRVQKIQGVLIDASGAFKTFKVETNAHESIYEFIFTGQSHDVRFKFRALAGSQRAT